MTKKWIAINLLLLMFSALLGRQLYVSIRRFNAENDLARIQPVQDMKQQMVKEKPLPQLPPAKNYLPAEFAIIPEKNVFSESRSKEESSEAAVTAEAAPLVQKPVLVGVTMANDELKALILDPTSQPQDRSRRAQTKRIGDVYQGYTITGITLDHIVLESGPRREIIPLHEGSKRIQGGKTPILSTRVVSFGGGGVSGGMPVTVSSGGPPTARTTAVPIASPAPVAGAQPGSGQTVTGQVRTPVTSTKQPAAIQQVQPATGQPAQSAPAQNPGQRVIRTPFGDIIRPIPKQP